MIFVGMLVRFENNGIPQDGFVTTIYGECGTPETFAIQICLASSVADNVDSPLFHTAVFSELINLPSIGGQWKNELKFSLAFLKNDDILAKAVSAFTKERRTKDNDREVYLDEVHPFLRDCGTQLRTLGTKIDKLDSNAQGLVVDLVEAYGSLKSAYFAIDSDAKTKQKELEATEENLNALLSEVNDAMKSATDENLENLKKKAAENRLFKCPQCERALGNKGALTRHINITHSQAGGKGKIAKGKNDVKGKEESSQS